MFLKLILSWSPDGKYIYFSSDRKNPSYPLGMQESSIYRASLDWFDQAYKSEKFDNLFVEEKKVEKKEKKEEKNDFKALTINPEGFLERIELVTDRFGYQTNPFVFADDKKQFLFYNTNQENGKFQLYRKTTTDFEEDKTDKIFNKGADFIVKMRKIFML